MASNGYYEKRRKAANEAFQKRIWSQFPDEALEWYLWNELAKERAANKNKRSSKGGGK